MGGGCVDASAGRLSRPHLDVDLVILRQDAPLLGRHLAGWDLRLARDGTLSDWDRQELAADDHQVWARLDDGYRPERWQDFALDPGFVEFLTEQVHATGNIWIDRRDPAIRAPLARLGPPRGFLSPEVAVLYKAAAAVGADPVVSSTAQSDFDHCASHLTAEQLGFELVVCSARLGYRKPHSTVFQALTGGLDVEAGSILFVGDSWNDDVEGARAFGMPVVHVARSRPCPASDHSGVPCVIDLNGVVELLPTPE